MDYLWLYVMLLRLNLGAQGVETYVLQTEIRQRFPSVWTTASEFGDVRASLDVNFHAKNFRSNFLGDKIYRNFTFLTLFPWEVNVVLWNHVAKFEGKIKHNGVKWKLMKNNCFFMYLKYLFVYLMGTLE